jgi:hypothetical protein
MKLVLERKQECQVELINYTKRGERFINVLTLIPIRYGPDGREYIVGFQARKPPEMYGPSGV